MKPWPLTDRSSPDRAATREYLGRTPEEALAKAAAALGPSAELRCWKTRRGGVGGFFATEVYVAGSTPPRGATDGPDRARRTPTDGTSRARATQAESTQGTDGAPPAPAPEHGTASAPDALSALAEGTTDQVSIHPAAVSPAAFDALLAEAEAALGHDTALPADSDETLPAALDALDALDAPTDPAANAANTASTPSPGREPERVPDLRARLRALGVPEAFLPRGQQPTLDAVACALDTLPAAPAPDARPGEIVLVVGAEGLVEQTGDLLADALRLGRRDLVRCSLAGEEDGTDDGETESDEADRITAIKVNAAVRVAKRRAGGSTSLVVLTTAPDQHGAAVAADLIECLRPHRVFAAVGASVKRADAERWLQSLGPVDALALWDLDSTRTPGELLGLAPIAYADGTACTTLSWTAKLLAHLSADRPE